MIPTVLRVGSLSSDTVVRGAGSIELGKGTPEIFGQRSIYPTGAAILSLDFVFFGVAPNQPIAKQQLAITRCKARDTKVCSSV